MKCLIVFALIISALLYVSASPLLPLQRHKRQQATSFDLKNPGIGTLSHTGTIVDNQNHLLTGTGYASKDFTRGGLKPDAYGAQVDYSHKPSGSVLGLGADHVRRAGTDVRASGTWNFVNTKNAEVGLNGQYGRHFGAGAAPVDDFEDDPIIPEKLRKIRRQQTSYGFRSPGIGTVSHTGTILDNQNNLLTGTGYASKDFTSGGAFLKPDVYGAQVDYSHKQSGSGVGVGADHIRRAGTDVRATGTWNIVNTKNADVGVSGQYEKHFGPGGSHSDYGVVLKGTVLVD
ncbi:unnamed protein product [Ceutorhynchus assimilis]|uniref:Attacin C-terminal domain-containing protein n=1 Tax=Ceutorhynchus assimilis TaxID=467358 RepID=A0A9N9MXE2_9CUCU|nr:unnamed protein product [Ceutorhynchus assimilis]